MLRLVAVGRGCVGERVATRAAPVSFGEQEAEATKRGPDQDLDCRVAAGRNQLCKPLPPLWAHVERNTTLKSAALNGYTHSFVVTGVTET